jgi:hypothetical protein
MDLLVVGLRKTEVRKASIYEVTCCVPFVNGVVDTLSLRNLLNIE